MKRKVYSFFLVSILVLLICSTEAFPLEKLNREVLDKSLQLGTSFLLSNQKESGNFTYEYDWRRKTFSTGDSQVRQAGASWGISLIYQDSPSALIERAARRSMDFFQKNSRLRRTGSRYVVYPGDTGGRTGTVALCALALIDFLRVNEGRINEEDSRYYRNLLDEYIGFLLEARDKNGLWHSSYIFLTGTPYGASSPYFDGESLLALIKAARYLERVDLIPVILDSAEKGYWKNVALARKKEKDSPVTKGYFQWACMCYFELALSGWEGTEQYADRLIDLAHWMIDVHRTLQRTRNTAYAYEGIIPAYYIAREKGRTEEAAKFRRTIEQGLAKLCTWQVGSPWANSFIKDTPTDDPMAIGGIQNHSRESLLRIDVAQHQMHAVILARRYVYP